MVAHQHHCLYTRKSLESLHLTWWLFKYGNPSNCDIRNSTTNTALMWQRKRESQELMEIDEQGVKCNSKPDDIQIIKTNTDRYFLLITLRNAPNCLSKLLDSSICKIMQMNTQSYVEFYFMTVRTK